VWMNLAQKMVTVFGAFAARSEIKRLLARRYWEAHKTFVVDFAVFTLPSQPRISTATTGSMARRSKTKSSQN
jgi:hypothetical protein